MILEVIKYTLIENECDLEISTIVNNSIYCDLGVYGESYDCEIEILNTEELTIGFNYFEAMNTVQDIINAIQFVYNNSLEVIYEQKSNEWKYTVRLRKY